MRLPFIPWSIAGVPSSQALPGFLITAPPSVCVPAVIGAPAMWIQNQKKKTHGAGAMLSDICTIRMASLMRVRRAHLHLIWWLLSATKTSRASLLRHHPAIQSTQCGPIFLYWTALCPGTEKGVFKRLLFL